MLVLYELGGRNGQRYSQFSWRSRMALAHKGLAAESRPVRVSDKQAIAFSGQDKVPILTDDKTVVPDSWKIAEHLETAYPDKPLFGGEIGRALSRFVNAWVDRQMVPRLVSMLMLDVVRGIVDEEDGAHLRRVIEKAFGKPLEELAAGRADIASFRRLLDPARMVLRSQAFLSGAAPAYADYILFSPFQWARIVSDFDPLEANDALAAWRERMLDLHDGLARREPARGQAS